MFVFAVAKHCSLTLAMHRAARRPLSAAARQRAPYPPHRLAHAAAQPRERAVCRRRRARRDELHDALGLAQVEAAVEERAQRELPGLGGARARLDRGGEDAAAADGAAVDLELYHVLARVGAVWSSSFVL